MHSRILQVCTVQTFYWQTQISVRLRNPLIWISAIDIAQVQRVNIVSSWACQSFKNCNTTQVGVWCIIFKLVLQCKICSAIQCIFFKLLYMFALNWIIWWSCFGDPCAVQKEKQCEKSVPDKVCKKKLQSAPITLFLHQILCLTTCQNRLD